MFPSAFSVTSFQPPMLLTIPTPYQLYNIDDDTSSTEPLTQSVFPEDSEPEPSPFAPPSQGESWTPFPPYISQASSPHNRRMIIPYECSRGSKRLPPSRDEPLVVYRFYEFYCPQCEQSWLSPLYRARSGCFCRTCRHFVMPRGIKHSFTPYLGKETCYGKYKCHLCRRGWSSYKSMSNCADKCFCCGTLVFPFYQIAFSVLRQKIAKNSCSHNITSSVLQSFLRRMSPPSGASHGYSMELQDNSETHQNLPRVQKRLRNPRRMTSISAIQSHSLTKQASTNIKKRLHCLNNVPFLNQQHSAQLRRQIHLKPCFSEPTIGTGSSNGIS